MSTEGSNSKIDVPKAITAPSHGLEHTEKSEEVIENAENTSKQESAKDFMERVNESIRILVRVVEEQEDTSQRLVRYIEQESDGNSLSFARGLVQSEGFETIARGLSQSRDAFGEFGKILREANGGGEDIDISVIKVELLTLVDDLVLIMGHMGRGVEAVYGATQRISNMSDLMHDEIDTVRRVSSMTRAAWEATQDLEKSLREFENDLVIN